MDFFKKAKAGLKDAQDVAKMLGIDKMSLGDKKADAAAPGAAPAVAAAPTYASAPPSSTVKSPITAVTPAPAHAGSVNTSVAPSANPNAPKKLPMTARKSIRDDFDSKKPEIETRLSTLLGTPWTIFVDAASVYSYSVDSESRWAKENPGAMWARYFEGGFYNLEKYVKNNGADGVAQLNALASGHVWTLEPGEKPYANRYCYCDISGGKLRTLFVPEMQGSNVDNALDNLPNVVSSTGSAAGGGAELTLAARSSIRNEYEAGIGEVLADAKRQVKAEYDFVFIPNFEDTYAKLKAHISKMDDEDKRHPFVDNFDTFIGRAVLSYFAGFAFTLKTKGFRKDEMMQEAFHDAVDKHEVMFRLDDNLPATRRYNDCIIEDGRLVMRSKVDQFWTNVDNACEPLMDLL